MAMEVLGVDLAEEAATDADEACSDLLTRGLTRRCASNLGREGKRETPLAADFAKEFPFGFDADAAAPFTPPPPLFITGHTAGAFHFDCGAPKFRFISFVEKIVGLKTKGAEAAVDAPLPPGVEDVTLTDGVVLKDGVVLTRVGVGGLIFDGMGDDFFA